MSEEVRIACGNVFVITFTALWCIALTAGIVVGLICVIKWLKGDYKENGT